MKDLEELPDEKFVSLLAGVVSHVLPHEDSITLAAEVGRRLCAASAAVAAAAASVPEKPSLAQLVERLRRNPEPFPLLQKP